MKTPRQQLDKLARYLINNHGDIVCVDDLSNEEAVDEAIRVMEALTALNMKWISVKDELPDKSDDVLLWNGAEREIYLC